MLSAMLFSFPIKSFRKTVDLRIVDDADGGQRGIPFVSERLKKDQTSQIQSRNSQQQHRIGGSRIVG